MTVGSVASPNDYLGNGAVSSFAYTFYIQSKTHLLVTTRVNATGVEATLVVDVDYTVSGVGNPNGGNITLTAGNLPSTKSIFIRRVLPITQNTDIRNQGDFYPEIHEDAFDRSIMIDQQQQQEIDHSVKLPETISPSDFDPTLPEDIATENRTLMTNSSGDGFAMGPSATEVGNAQTYANNAASSATAAAASATSAATQATNASNSATTASTQATNAASSASAASTSATASAASATAAQTAETNAETAETNAETAQASAETAETNAETAATAAAASASSASTSATNAANSASTASTQASNASTSASNAASSATTASTQASNASTSATNAANSATSAASSASSAAAAVSSHEADTTNIHGIPDTSILATTTGTQNLSNKTSVAMIHQGDRIDDYLDFDHESSPSAPGGGKLRVFSKSDNKLYKISPAGLEQKIGSDASGGKNYFSDNPDFESAITGYTAYDDGASATPVNGTGGSPASSIARSTTTPLRGTADANWVHTAADNQGEGFSYDITIDNADLAKMMYGSFDYEIVSGTYATGDATMYIVQDPAGTPVIIQPAGYQIQNINGKGRHIFSFQTDYSQTSYRVCWHIATATATAWTMAVDNIQLGPAASSYGAPITDWESFTSTGSWVSGCTYAGKKRRVGDSLECEVKITASGAVTAATLTVNLPSGLSIDTNKTVTSLLGVDALLGTVSVLNEGIAGYIGYTLFNDATSVRPHLVVTNSTYGSATVINATTPFTFGNLDTVVVNFRVPIAGWSSNMQFAGQDTDTRVVAARYFASVDRAIDASTNANYDTKVFDTHSMVSSGVVTVPVPGYYRASVMTASTSAEASLEVYKNGTKYGRIAGITDQTQDSGTILVGPCNAGDTISIRASGSVTLDGEAGDKLNSFDIERLAGPSAIAASESVSLTYVPSGAQSITGDGNWHDISFATKVADSHGSYNGTTFTAPIQGRFLVNIKREMAASTSGVRYLGYIENGVQKYAFATAAGQANPYQHTVSFVIRLLAGQTFKINGVSDTTTMNFTTADALSNQLSIDRVGNY